MHYQSVKKMRPIFANCIKYPTIKDIDSVELLQYMKRLSYEIVAPSTVLKLPTGKFYRPGVVITYQDHIEFYSANQSFSYPGFKVSVDNEL